MVENDGSLQVKLTFCRHPRSKIQAGIKLINNNGWGHLILAKITSPFLKVPPIVVNASIVDLSTGDDWQATDLYNDNTEIIKYGTCIYSVTCIYIYVTVRRIIGYLISIVS